MENNTEFPISTLKVDFGCTKGCSTDVSNMLQQLKGVKSISVDPKEGKVIVVGNVNPLMIIKVLQKMGKKAQLWSFDKEPKKEKEPKEKTSRSHAKHKHCCPESSGTADDSETDHDYGHKNRTHRHQRSNHMHDQHNNMFGFGNQHAPPPPVNGYQQAPPPGYQYAPPPMAGYNHQPFSGYHNYPPMPRYQPQHMAYPMPPSMYMRSRPLHGYQYHGPGQPAWPAYGNYGSRFPSYNPMIHYNSYADNYRYTI